MAAEGPAAPFIPQAGGGRRLAGDARLAFLLLNEARYRSMERVFGCTREQTNAATVVGVLVVAHGVHTRWRRIMDAPMAPALPDELIGAAVFREMLSGAAGPAVRDSPQLGNLLLAATVAAGGLPVILRGLRAAKSASHRLDSGFRHRYGYLVDVGHRRARHYEKQARKAVGRLEADAEGLEADAERLEADLLARPE